MKVFSNKREKMCVFFKSRGVNVALFLFIPYIIYRNPPLKKNNFSLMMGRKGLDRILLKS